MKRGISLVLALVAAMLAVPASAAAPPNVVYEIARLRPAAHHSAHLRIWQDGPGLSMYALLQPSEDGGYTHTSAGYLYSTSRGTLGTSFTVDLTGGKRLIVGGRRGTLRFHINERYWGVRQVGTGFRTVAPAPKSTTDVAGRRLEEFESASAPAGPYGSTVVASVPCGGGVGTWTLSTDTEPPGVPRPCVASEPMTWSQTRAGRVWNLEGPIYGTATWPYRLVVLDHPR